LSLGQICNVNGGIVIFSPIFIGYNYIYIKIKVCHFVTYVWSNPTNPMDIHFGMYP
jgi:hypothetical protein